MVARRFDTSKDYYQILHVSESAPTEVIKASFRTMMQKLGAHPDRGGDHDAAAAINEAYQILTDAALRAQYDAARAEGNTPSSSHIVRPDEPVYEHPVSNAEQRQIPRQEKTAPVEYLCQTLNNQGLGHLSDLSPDGAALALMDRIEIGTVIKLENDFFKAAGKVVRIQASHDNPPYRFQAGIEFVRIEFNDSKGVFVNKSI